MKTMGLTDLVLVSPRDFPSTEANKMAAGAEDLLASAKVVGTVVEAISDCTFIAATTVRPRGYDLPTLEPEQAAHKLLLNSAHSPVAVIFGPERMGLHNKDLQHAKYRVSIPANPHYGSLNLAAAVQILSYEIFKRFCQGNPPATTNVTGTERALPTSAEIEHLLTHLEKVLHEINFLRPHQGETMQRLRNLLARGEPDVIETNILRGILSAIEKTQRDKII
jgi:tRNA (cytidine32/uridine32-2'-O)-methyltransferase